MLKYKLKLDSQFVSQVSNLPPPIQAANKL